MTIERRVFELDEARAGAVNAIRSDYYDRLVGARSETEDRIMEVTGLLRPESNWLLMRDEPATAGPLPEEAFR